MNDGLELSSHKRHKKHKKKHKRKHADDPTNDEKPKPAIKLKIKIGQETFGEKSVTKTEISGGDPSDQSSVNEASEDGGDLEEELPLLDDDRPESDSDDEQEWLKALEAGELDDTGALKKRKETKTLTLTKRQKALAESKSRDSVDDNVVVNLVVPAQTDDRHKRELRAKKRRQASPEKKDKEKKHSLEKILKKQETRIKIVKARETSRPDIPRVHYVQSQTSCNMSFPDDVDLPFCKKTAPDPPKPILCAAPGCQNMKRYSCSKTLKPICSLDCYRKNLAALVPNVVVTSALG